MFNNVPCMVFLDSKSCNSCIMGPSDLPEIYMPTAG